MSLILVDLNAKRANFLRDYLLVSSDEHSIGGPTCYNEIMRYSENMESNGSVAHGRSGGDPSLCPESKKKKCDGTSHSDREDPLRCEPSTPPDWPWA